MRISDWSSDVCSSDLDFDFTDKLFSAVPRTPLSPSNLGFRQYTVQDESGDEYIWTGRLDVTRKLGFGDDSWLKVGGKYRATDKVFDSNNSIFTRGGNAATRFTFGQFGLQGADVGSRVGGGHDYVIYIGRTSCRDRVGQAV